MNCDVLPHIMHKVNFTSPLVFPYFLSCVRHRLPRGEKQPSQTRGAKQHSGGGVLPLPRRSLLKLLRGLLRTPLLVACRLASASVAGSGRCTCRYASDAGQLSQDTRRGVRRGSGAFEAADAQLASYSQARTHARDWLRWRRWR